MLSHSWLPGPTLCDVRIMFIAEVCMLPLSEHLGLPSAPLASVGFSQFLDLLSGLGHSLWAFMGWEVQLSVFCLLNPCFVQLLRFFSSLLGPSVRELPRAQELFLLHDSHPASGHKLPSRSSPSFPFLCLYSLPYFITESLVYPHGGLGYSRVCFVGIIPYHDEFFMYLWGGRPDDLPVLLLCLLHQTSFLMKWYSVS